MKEAVKRAVGVELGKIGEYRGIHYVHATRPVLATFEERAVKAEAPARPLEVRVEGNSIVVRHGGVEHGVEFALVKGKEDVFVDSSLYPALQRLGVRAELKPQGVKLYRDGMWGLLAAAVESALERGEKPTLLPDVSLLWARPDKGHYVFLAEMSEGRYVYSVL